MRRRSIAGFAAGLCGLGAAAWSPTARADEAEAASQSMPARSKAFELQLDTGYTQGFGNLSPSSSIGDVAGAGLALGVSAGYRATPRISVELEGQYQQYAPATSLSTNGINTNVGVTFHALPESRGDPWLRVATGWRSIGQHSPTGPAGSGIPNTANTFHGWQVIAARLGYDFRTSPGIAWGPVIGADLQAFFWENGAALSPAQVGMFVYAGFNGRFDTAGAAPKPTASAAPPL